MLYDLTAVKANIRNREGKRVFYLGKGHQLTSEARDHLMRERIEILPAEQAAPDSYQLLSGGSLTEKPEDMTHLYGNVLVKKTHPRIRFRGKIDALEGEILMCQVQAPAQLREKLADGLELARKIISWEVLDEPVKPLSLGGLTDRELRDQSHRPQDFYGQPHFMPSWQDGPLLLQLNRARYTARQAELAAVDAFTDRDGKLTRKDIVQALNRLSSFLYILMIQEKRRGGADGHL